MPLPPPTVEIYYASTCAPCRLELPDIAAFEKSGAARVRIVILGDAERARDELEAASAALARDAIVAKEKSPRTALLAAGDRDAILPYARVVAAGGEVCATWRGRFVLSRAQGLLDACRRSLSAPRSQRS